MTEESRNHIYGGDGINHHKTHRRKRRLIIFISIGIVLLIGAGVAAVLVLLQPSPEAPKAAVIKKEEPEPEPVIYYSPLTGKEVKDKAATKQAVTAVIIENSPDARPQSGLKQSGVVFEAIAEGGITRFLVLYQQEKPTLVGPVRSVRQYFVDWLNPFNASIAHVGGSANALAVVRNGNYRDIDQFFNSQYYWRATDRFAPHNVYTNFKNLDALNKSKGYTTSTFTGFDRKDSEAAKEPKATKINVTISSPSFNSSYVYTKATNSYDRSVGGVPHLDREAGQISPRVVITMQVDESTVLEDGWREKIVTIGSGRAHIFQDGTVQNVAWIKKSKGDQLYFIDDSGKTPKRVNLARGQTWITAVPNNGGNVTWN